MKPGTSNIHLVDRIAELRRRRCQTVRGLAARAADAAVGRSRASGRVRADAAAARVAQARARPGPRAIAAGSTRNAPRLPEARLFAPGAVIPVEGEPHVVIDWSPERPRTDPDRGGTS